METQAGSFDAQTHPTESEYLQPNLHDFTAELKAAGYNSLAISDYRASITHFGRWAQSKGVSLQAIDDEVVARFASHRCTCFCARKGKPMSRRYSARVRRFTRYLGERGAAKVGGTRWRPYRKVAR